MTTIGRIDTRGAFHCCECTDNCAHPTSRADVEVTPGHRFIGSSRCVDCGTFAQDVGVRAIREDEAPIGSENE